MSKESHTAAHGDAHDDDEVVQFASDWNGRLGIAQAVVAGITLNLPVAADAWHNYADKKSHKGYAEAIAAEKNNNIADKVKSRKRSALFLCSGALAIGAVAGIDALYHEQETALNYPALGIEAASIALNGIVAYKFMQRTTKYEGQAHSEIHNLVDLGTSAVAFAGVAATAIYPYADNIAAVIVSAASFSLGTLLYFDKVD